jgi:NADPH:quinone reductase-like Zn-dependent oxidoreductase
VLINAAAGGVGHLSVQLAEALGASRVVAAVGSMAKAGFVRGLGADEVLSYGEACDWGEQVDVVLDGVGGDTLGRCLDALRPFGRLVGYNGIGGPVDTNTLRMRGAAVIGFNMMHFSTIRADRSSTNCGTCWPTGDCGPRSMRNCPLWTQSRRIGSSRLAPTWARSC